MNLQPLLTLLDFWADMGKGLDAMMQPIYWAISGIVVGFHWLYSHFLNPDSGLIWLLSIVSLTIVVRVAMIPLFVRQINSSRKMQLLQPKMKALQEKYGTDREKLGQEQMKMYKEEGVNPFASCLPLLLQMPIFIGLFNVLNAVSNNVPVGQFFVDNPNLVHSLRNSTLFGASLAGKFMPMDGGFGPNQVLAGLLIIGLVVTLFFTQLHMMRKNMPPEALTGPLAQQQKTMLYILPLSYLFFGISIPIGVMLYWFASNLWTLAQQYILIHNAPTPNTPAYIDWEERMRARGKDPEAILRKRLGMDRRPKATEAADPTKVARQGTTRATSSPATDATTTTDRQPPTSGAAASDEGGERRNIARQQPNKRPRAARKKS